ncbi:MULTISPECIES: DUF3563 family protein [unclassified Lentilitoribacter]|jgi:hypothetical protein|uniref:DUF3563 family protein n=1 Tax=unclassified Lentilitoribacter TaxID=2647570 RepID=UPI0013A6983D|nr:DUF3563 family protein [Lentilitoribacter sp. Alg239-R112]
MKFFDLFNHDKHRRDAENEYLNTARNLVDLENRMREIDRGKFRNGNPIYR